VNLDGIVLDAQQRLAQLEQDGAVLPCCTLTPCTSCPAQGKAWTAKHMTLADWHRKRKVLEIDPNGTEDYLITPAWLGRLRRLQRQTEVCTGDEQAKVLCGKAWLPTCRPSWQPPACDGCPGLELCQHPRRVLHRTELIRLKKQQKDEAGLLTHYMEDYRGNADEGAVVGDPNTPESQVVRDELRQEMQKRLEALPDRWRELVLAHYAEGVPAVDLAEQRGVSKSAISHQLRKARETLCEGLNFPDIYHLYIDEDAPRTAASSVKKQEFHPWEVARRTFRRYKPRRRSAEYRNALPEYLAEAFGCDAQYAKQMVPRGAMTPITPKCHSYIDPAQKGPPLLENPVVLAYHRARKKQMGKRWRARTPFEVEWELRRWQGQSWSGTLPELDNSHDVHVDSHVPYNAAIVSQHHRHDDLLRVNYGAVPPAGIIDPQPVSGGHGGRLRSDGETEREGLGGARVEHEPVSFWTARGWDWRVIQLPGPLWIDLGTRTDRTEQTVPKYVAPLPGWPSRPNPYIGGPLSLHGSIPPIMRNTHSLRAWAAMWNKESLERAELNTAAAFADGKQYYVATVALWPGPDITWPNLKGLPEWWWLRRLRMLPPLWQTARPLPAGWQYDVVQRSPREAWRGIFPPRSFEVELIVP